MTPFAKQQLTILSLIMLLITTLACQAADDTASSTSSTSSTPADCSQTDPSEEDLNYALNFTGDTFTPEEWERSYFVELSRAAVTWLSHEGGWLAYLEMLIYNCGYTQETVDEFFSDQNFEEVIFRDYQNLQSVATCTEEKDKLTLYEFTADFQEAEYQIRFWVSLESERRIVSFMLVFPQGKGWLDSYAEEVFPTLSSCQS